MDDIAIVAMLHSLTLSDPNYIFLPFFTGAVEHNAAIFANSWKTKQCVNEKPVKDGCSVNVQRVSEAKQKCSALSSPPFNVCHEVVNPLTHIEHCEQEVCGCPPGETCHCHAIQNYVRECVNQGVNIQWTNTTECGKYGQVLLSIPNLENACDSS